MANEREQGQVRTARVAATLALATVIGTTGMAHAAGSATSATTTVGHIVQGRVARSRVAKELVGRQGIAIDERTGRVFVVNAGYASRGRGSVAVLDARSGRLLRTTPVGLYPIAAVADERAGRVFVLNGGLNLDVPGTVSVLDARDGRLLRTIGIEKHPLAVAVDETTGRVFVASIGNTGNGYAATVAVLDAASGRVLRTVPVGNSPEAVAVDARLGQVYVAGDYQLKLLDEATGAVLRTVTVGNHPHDALVDARVGRVFLDEADGSIDVLDARTGVLMHAIPEPTPGWRSHGFAVAAVVDEAANRLVVGAVTAWPTSSTAWADPSGRAGILDALTGRPLHDVALRSQAVAVVMDAPAGLAFVLETGATNIIGATLISAGVDALDPTSGIVRRRTTLDASTSWGALSVDQSTGRVFVAGFDRIAVLDAMSGAVLRVVPLATGPGVGR